jgi:hypothetical protein
MRRIDRREFTKEASLAFLSGVTVTISACGGGGGGGYSSPTTPNPTPTTSAGDKVGQISDNHGHEAVITSAQLAAGNAVQINIEARAGHPHMVSLPAQAVVDIREGRPVETQSTTNDGHNHLVTFNANSTSPPTRY